MTNYSQKKSNQPFHLPKENETNLHLAQEIKPITLFEGNSMVKGFLCRECGTTNPKNCKGGSNICPWR